MTTRLAVQLQGLPRFVCTASLDTLMEVMHMHQVFAT